MRQPPQHYSNTQWITLLECNAFRIGIGGVHMRSEITPLPAAAPSSRAIIGMDCSIFLRMRTVLETRDSQWLASILHTLYSFYETAVSRSLDIVWCNSAVTTLQEHTSLLLIFSNVAFMTYALPERGRHNSCSNLLSNEGAVEAAV
jgi:hypothetical protein